MAIAEDRFVFVPLEQATVPPPGLIEHFKDRWWDGSPEEGTRLLRQKGDAPQCNGNEAISRRLAAAYPWAVIQFVPSVFRRINPNDYV